MRNVFLKKTIAAFAAALTLMTAAAVLPSSDSGTGILAGRAAAADVTGNIVLNGMSLTLNGEIGVNFYLDIKDASAVDSFLMNGPNGAKTVRLSEISPETAGSCAGMYKLTYLTDPTQLGEAVTLSPKKGSSKITFVNDKGTRYGLRGASLSVREYIDAVKAGSGFGSNLKALADALDTYGRYAGAEFASAPDPGLDAKLPDVSSEKLEKYKFEKSGDLPEGVSILGSTLLIDSRTSFRIYFDKDPGKAAIDEAPAEVKQKDGKFYIEVPDIAAPDLDEFHEAVVGGCTMRFCALSYAYSVIGEDNGVSEKTVKLVKALYAYAFAANSYFDTDFKDALPTITSEDILLTRTGSTGSAESYTFLYGGETFSAYYTTGSGGNWKIEDSYKITNKADMAVICEALQRERKVKGCITEFRTANDMADEWEIHNMGYSVVKDIPSYAAAAARLKDVDLDRKDQGKTLEDFVRDFLGR